MHQFNEGRCRQYRLKCATPGDTTTVTGGIHEDFQLNRVLLRMRAQPAKGKLVVICTKIEKEWRIARLSGIRGVPPEFVTDKVYDNEQDPQHDIFLMRLGRIRPRPTASRSTSAKAGSAATISGP